MRRAVRTGLRHPPSSHSPLTVWPRTIEIPASTASFALLVAAENDPNRRLRQFAVKHQLLIMKRSRRRAPNLTSWDRLMLGFYTLLASPKRVRKMAVITKASTLMRLHQALVKRKYHLLYGSQRPRRPGPKGPSSELIAAVVEMKRRNPRMGCRKIAEQISSAFGIENNKDVVRRILIQYYRPAPGSAGPCWLSLIGQARDSLWSVDLFRCESILLQSY